MMCVNVIAAVYGCHCCHEMLAVGMRFVSFKLFLRVHKSGCFCTYIYPLLNFQFSVLYFFYQFKVSSFLGLITTSRAAMFIYNVCKLTTFSLIFKEF